VRTNWKSSLSTLLFSTIAMVAADAQSHPMTSTSLGGAPDYGTPQPRGVDSAEVQAIRDREFIKKTVAANATAATLQALAEKNSQNEQIKQLARKMAEDHLRLANQIQPIAQQLGFAPKADSEHKDKKLFSRLGGLSGTQFDDEFINSVMKEHHQVLKDFNQEAAKTQNVALRDAAKDGATIISQHLEMLETIIKNHGVKDSKPEKAS